MSSIAPIMNMGLMPVERLEKKLGVMNRLQAHRGNDGEGVWTSPDQCVGLAQRRLAVIDMQGGQQPLSDDAGNWICFDGFLSNYQQLREELAEKRNPQVAKDDDDEVVGGEDTEAQDDTKE